MLSKRTQDCFCDVVAVCMCLKIIPFQLASSSEPLKLKKYTRIKFYYFVVAFSFICHIFAYTIGVLMVHQTGSRSPVRILIVGAMMLGILSIGAQVFILMGYPLLISLFNSFFKFQHQLGKEHHC